MPGLVVLVLSPCRLEWDQEGETTRDALISERGLRLAAMLCGTIAVIGAASLHVNGAVTATGSILIGFSVGVGVSRRKNHLSR